MPAAKEKKWSDPSMMIHTGPWGPVSTFKLFPVTKDCPYVECIYNVTEGVLAVIGVNRKEQFHMVNRLDDMGQPVEIKNAKRNPDDPHKKQRVTVNSYSEYYITERKEIEAFLEGVAINFKEFNTKKILDMKMADPKAIEKKPGIILDNVGN